MGMEAIVGEVMELARKAAIIIPRGAVLEIYHHLGLSRYRETGAAIITCFNHRICKKFIILIPGQTLPAHRHSVKEEIFTLLWGDAGDLWVGDTLHILPGKMHSLTSKGGAVLEEISTEYLPNDSTYEDLLINDNPGIRKTEVKRF